MTKTKQYIESLPDDIKGRIEKVFLSVDNVYATIYLMAKNEHLTAEEKPERYEDRLQVMKQVKQLAELFFDALGLNGADLMADIASEYFDDYVNYKELTFDLSNADFLLIIRNISSAGAA